MINNHLWEILVTFHQCGTLSAEAKMLYVSQPSLSVAMKQLEKDLGVTLFERTKNHIELNDVGLEAVRLAENYIKQERTIIQQLQEMSRRLRTVTVASYVSGLRKELVNRLSAMYPDRSITSEHLSSELLPLGLLQGRFDYVITEYAIEEPDVVCVPYVTDRLLTRLHKSDALAERSSVTLKDLQDSKLLVCNQSGFWATFIRKQLCERLQLVFVNDEQEYRDLLEAFDMRTFSLETMVSNMDLQTEYRYVPLAEEGTQVTFYLCCLQKNAHHIPKLLPRKK